MAESRLPPPLKFNSEAPDLFSEWQQWMNAFRIYATATELSEKSDEIQRATLLHCLGLATQRIFQTLPGEKKTYKEAETALEKYFAPKRNVVSERYKFRCRAQRHDEPIDCYLTALRELAKSCEFGQLENEMIRDQIVEKCHSKKLKERLLQQDTLDLDKAIRIAKTTENAEKEVQLMAGTGTKENPIVLNRLGSTRGRDEEVRKSCFRCGGRDDHSADKCGATSLKCRKWGKVGHLARVCCSSEQWQRKNTNRQRTNKKNKKTSRKIRAVASKSWLEEQSTSEEEDFEPVRCMNSKDGSVQVSINGQKMKMVVDTGSKQNIISSRLHKALFRDCELRPTKKKFMAYGQQTSLKCLGCFQATIQSGNNCIDSRVYVIEGEAESLLGRESSFNLEIIKLKLNVIHVALGKMLSPPKILKKKVLIRYCRSLAIYFKALVKSPTMSIKFRSTLKLHR